jgi:hypothetical protein
MARNDGASMAGGEPVEGDVVLPYAGPRPHQPFWVKVGLWGLSGRTSAWVFFWGCVIVAGFCTVRGVQSPSLVPRDIVAPERLLVLGRHPLGRPARRLVAGAGVEAASNGICHFSAAGAAGIAAPSGLRLVSSFASSAGRLA